MNVQRNNNITIIPYLQLSLIILTEHEPERSHNKRIIPFLRRNFLCFFLPLGACMLPITRILFAELLEWLGSSVGTSSQLSPDR